MKKKSPAFFLFFVMMIFCRQGFSFSKSDSSQVTFHTFFWVAEKNQLDTTLNYFQCYHPANVALPVRFSWYQLGNLGLPVYSFQNFIGKQNSFNVGRNATDVYRFDLGSVPFYDVHHPFSDLSYSVGQHAENLIQAIHAQPLGKYFVAQMNYRFLTSDGGYQLQKAIHHSFHFNLNYQSKNKHYSANAGMILNKLKWQENGGVADDSVFFHQYINKNVVPVRMTNANQQLKDENYYLQNNYHIGAKYSFKKNDTTTVETFVPFFTISHVFTSTSSYQHYADKAFDSLNYSAMNISTAYLDTFKNRDSLVGNWVTHQYSNAVFFNVLGEKKLIRDSTVYRHWLGNIGLQHDYIEVKQFNRNNYLHDISVHAQIEKNTARFYSPLYVKVSGDYYLYGYNQKDFRLWSFATYVLPMLPVSLGAAFIAKQTSPNFFYQHFYSNYFSVNQTLKAENLEHLKLYLNFYRMKLKLSWATAVQQNLIYLDSTALPKNYSKAVYTQQLGLNYTFHIHHFNFNNEALFNLKQAYPLNLPKVILFTNWYYENLLFKNALLAQVGMNVFYTTSYFAPNYNPVWNEFYWQDKSATNNLPVCDVFINLKIKTARIFFKMENVLQGFGNGNYNSTVYPQADRAFKVGVNWRFMD